MCLFNILCLFFRATLTNSPRAWVGMGEVRLFLDPPHLKIDGAGSVVILPAQNLEVSNFNLFYIADKEETNLIARSSHSNF